MKKRFISITALCIFLLCLTANADVSFDDVGEKYWAKEYIDNMVANGYIKGYPNGKFYPEKLITRAEFATLITSLIKSDVSLVNSSDFNDVKAEDWFLPFVEKAKYYLTGYKRSNGELLYFPNIAAKREDVAVAIVKFKGYEDSVYDISVLRTMYDDYSGISDGVAKYVAVAVEKGLMQGYEDRTFKPQSSISRAEVATLLWKAIQVGDGNKVAAVESEPVYTPINDSYVPMPVNDKATSADVLVTTPDTNDYKTIRDYIDEALPNLTEAEYTEIEIAIKKCMEEGLSAFNGDYVPNNIKDKYAKEFISISDAVSDVYVRIIAE